MVRSRRSAYVHGVIDSAIRLRAPARALARSLSFGAYCAGLLGIYEVHHRQLPIEARPRNLEGYQRRLGAAALRMLGVRLHWLGAIRRAEGPRLVISNHRTALDVAVLLSAFGGSLVSRADVEGWPLVGKLAERGETIYVRRGDRQSGAKTIRAIRSRFERGGTVLLFPEGTTQAGDRILPFHGGAFAAARGLEVEVVPVGLTYDPGIEYVDRTFGQHLFDVTSRPAIRAVACAGEPAKIRGRASQMAEQYREIVQDLVHRARHHHTHLGTGGAAAQ